MVEEGAARNEIGRRGERVAEVRTGSTIPSPVGWKALESVLERKEEKETWGKERRGEADLPARRETYRRDLLLR